MKTEETFEQWFEEAKQYAKSIYYPLSADPEDYRGYFEDGYSPGEAVREDWSYTQ